LFAGAVNAHPQLWDPLTPQQPAGSPATLDPQLFEHELEQLGVSVGFGHPGDWLHVAVEPPTLQLPVVQQQQHPATAPAPEFTPHELVEKIAHWRFVGVAAAAGEGTAIE
jgi:hypothetical protein